MDKKYGKCRICGKIELNSYIGYDGDLSIPVVLCPKKDNLEKYVKGLWDETYKSATGRNIENSFEKRTISPSHLSFDDDVEEAEKHTLEPIECWCEII